jgi:O-antigen ligase
LVIATGLLFLFLALGHIPVDIFPHAFDKNAPVHLLILIIISIAFSLYILINHHKLFISGKAVFLVVFLASVLLISSLNSPDFYGSLIGDAGRYTGAVSLLALLIVAIFHAQLKIDQFRKLALLYSFSVFLISVLGILQHFEIVELPGDSGVTSTLGNLDFFTAFVATSFPIFFYLFLTYRGRIRIAFAVMAAVNLISIRLSGALQGYVDLGIFVIGLGIYALRRRIPRFEASLSLKTFIGTTALVIWLEGIFLMPFLGTFIPVLGSDIQVRIRGQFWLAAINQFFHKPLLGVGPDQYGYYYERFRTIESVNEYPTILANDAHSSTAQSLATLGFLGALAFTALLALLIRSIFVLMEREKDQRKLIYSLALYLFVYLTNATISPITLPNKFLFWAVSGYLVGQAYLIESQTSRLINLNKKVLLSFLAVMSALNIFVAINHSIAQYQFMDKWEKFAKNQQSEIKVAHNKFLPCTLFYDNLSRIINSQGNMALEKFSQDQVNSNPRCVNAQITMAKLNYNKGDLVAMKKNVYALTEMAPNRSEVLALAGVYAQRAEDKDLFDKVTRQYAKLGITPLVVP